MTACETKDSIKLNPISDGRPMGFNIIDKYKINPPICKGSLLPPRWDYGCRIPSGFTCHGQFGRKPELI